MSKTFCGVKLYSYVVKNVYLEEECVVFLFTEAIDWTGFISCQAPVVDL